MGGNEAAEDTVVDQLHRLLVEVKDYLEDAESRKGQKLLGKVELVLDSWDSDEFFAEDDEDLDDDSSDEGSALEDLDEDDDEDLDDDSSDEGSALGELDEDEDDDEDQD